MFHFIYYLTFKIEKKMFIKYLLIQFYGKILNVKSMKDNRTTLIQFEITWHFTAVQTIIFTTEKQFFNIIDLKLSSCIYCRFK